MSSCKSGDGYGQPMSPQNEIKRSGKFTLKPPTVGQKEFAVAPHLKPIIAHVVKFIQHLAISTWVHSYCNIDLFRQVQAQVPKFVFYSFSIFIFYFKSSSWWRLKMAWYCYSLSNVTLPTTEQSLLTEQWSLEMCQFFLSHPVQWKVHWLS